ncbi:MAG: ankyrin repeat domain-containing protein, partial [Treponema sp.]|nr:ankyrin repeat domain-containing protein [Treponema sp.]
MKKLSFILINIIIATCVFGDDLDMIIWHASLHRCDSEQYDQYVVDVSNLLVAGADANEDFGRGYTAVMMASSYGLDDILKILVKNGGDVNKTATLTHYGEYPYYVGGFCNGITALMLAATPGCVEVLLNAGADVNTQDEQGRNALFFQCYFHRDSNIISLLVNAGSYLYNENDEESILFDVIADDP